MFGYLGLQVLIGIFVVLRWVRATPAPHGSGTMVQGSSFWSHHLRSPTTESLIGLPKFSLQALLLQD